MASEHFTTDKTQGSSKFSFVTVDSIYAMDEKLIITSRAQLEWYQNEKEQHNKNKYIYQIKKTNCVIGRALIIVNIAFKGKERIGGKKDIENLQIMFSSLNVESYVAIDQSLSKMNRSLEEFREICEMKNPSIVFVAISTHGGEGDALCAVDKDKSSGKYKNIEVADIVKDFHKSESLRGKPKVFFIQACRGNKPDTSYQIPEQMSTQSECDHYPTPPQEKRSYNFASETSDVLIAYATSPNCYAYRSEAYGSWFISELKKVFEEYKEKKHLLDILTMTTYNVINRGSTKHIECINVHSTLTKFIFF